MVLDPVWLGYGAGLVMSGWVCGMIVGTAFDVIGRFGSRRG